MPGDTCAQYQYRQVDAELCYFYSCPVTMTTHNAGLGPLQAPDVLYSACAAQVGTLAGETEWRLAPRLTLRHGGSPGQTPGWLAGWLALGHWLAQPRNWPC